jgi:hypothetical protein
LVDNFTTNAGSGGQTFASDDIGGIQHTRVKISSGRDGVASDVGIGFRRISTASTNAVNVKASAGTLYMIHAVNLNAAVRYLKLYNTASAPTVGTDTPVATFAIPASTTGAGFTVQFGPGFDFSTGISYAMTTGAADSDTGNVAANEIFLVGVYI